MMIVGPFARWAAHLLQGGYSPIPLKAGTKRPLIEGWDRLRSAAMSPAEIEALSRRHPDLGLAVAGGFNGLVPIDIDAEAEPIVNAICNSLPAFLVAKTGKRGFAGFFRDPAGAITGRKFQTAPRARSMLVEILASGKAVIPPTLHPETRSPYRWLTERTLFNTRVDELPEISPAHVRALELALRPWIPERRVHVPPVGTLRRRPVPHVSKLTRLRRLRARYRCLRRRLEMGGAITRYSSPLAGWASTPITGCSSARRSRPRFLLLAA
jgi:Bifunctional DNA primase/polymerase, N-terminal